MKTGGNQESNREYYLNSLRSGQYIKGDFIKGGDHPSDAEGFCAIGLPYTLFLNNEGPIIDGIKAVLGISNVDVYKIQNEWNDSSLTFPQVADLIEHFIFN